ncbi:MAG: RNase H-like domain-containing protein, partial [Candidatus Thiodiazotropha endolucinida]|nr:DDE-type integrase/transposase/recombinase [Candidatus Thiodiazotropha taylori]MCW4264337.1 RNase H-like domain-containing protein [Candidatus Thiodiazotropha endolucinida]
MKLDLSAPGPFNVMGEQTNLAQKWNQYVKRLDYYMKASNVNKDEQKRALLLHVAGEEVQDLFDTLSDTGTSYDDALEALNLYFEPKKNIAFERHLFRQAKQQSDETVDNFIVRLSKLALGCDFDDHQKNDMIRDQVVDCCKSTELRKKLLSEQTLTLERVRTISRTFELSSSHAKQMSENNKTSDDNSVEINRLQGARRKQAWSRPGNGNAASRSQRQTGSRSDTRSDTTNPGKQGRRFTKATAECYRCGGKGHYGRECQRAKDVVCRDCGHKGHFARMCKSKVKNVNIITSESDQKNQYVDTTECENYEEIFVLGKQDATVSLQISGKQLNILIDSGASVNAIDHALYQQLKSSQSVLQKSDAKIYPYGKRTPLELCGKVLLPVQVGSDTREVEFQVIKGTGKPLIGHKTATELGLLRIGVPEDIATVNTETERILASYQDRFEGLGKLKDFELKLHVDESVKPVAQPARKIPFKMRSQVERKLKELEAQDVIERVQGPTPWVSALVPIPKKDGDVRLCVDMRQANKAVQRERFPMPNVEITLEQMNGAKVFSRIDLRNSFHQIPLQINSRYITTFASHNGLYRYKRLFFGINSAPEVHQRILQHIIQDIQGCKNIADDIIIFAQNQDEHNKILEKLLSRLREKNLTLNRDKCEFNKSELRFMGHILTQNGLKIDEHKVKAALETKEPTNATECKSFLGLVGYLSKFIRNYATLAEPLRRLTRNDVPWTWGDDEQRSFDALKTAITSTDVMAYYNENAETNLLVDGSPFGLGAILTQKQPDGNFRPVAYASRTLNAVERRYSQIEREALAILWAIERFRVYLYGLDFTVFTDSRPLERIFSRSHDTLSPRIQNWVLRLQSYTFRVTYRPGLLNPADIFSRPAARDLKESITRDPIIAELTDQTEQFISNLTESSLPIAITLQELQQASQQDEIFRQVRQYLQTNRWRKKGNLMPYFQVRHELSVKDDLILKGSKLVIPTQLQERVLNLAHETHRGLKKTKQLLRSKVWFPNIDHKVDNLIKMCRTCQMTSSPPRAPPVMMSKLPDGPWKKVGLDLSGPYGSNNEYVMALIDYYSRFPVVEILRSTTSATIVNKLHQIFAMHGLVEEIVTDNASNLVSSTVENFLHEYGIKHSRISPYWSRHNGLVENFNRSVRKAVRVALVQGKNWRTELHTFLLHFRATEHSTTGYSPARLLYNREIKTKLPQINTARPPKGLI